MARWFSFGCQSSGFQINVDDTTETNLGFHQVLLLQGIGSFQALLLASSANGPGEAMMMSTGYSLCAICWTSKVFAQIHTCAEVSRSPRFFQIGELHCTSLHSPHTDLRTKYTTYERGLADLHLRTYPRSLIFLRAVASTHANFFFGVWCDHTFLFNMAVGDPPKFTLRYAGDVLDARQVDGKIWFAVDGQAVLTRAQHLRREIPPQLEPVSTK